MNPIVVLTIYKQIFQKQLRHPDKLLTLFVFTLDGPHLGPAGVTSDRPILTRNPFGDMNGHIDWFFKP